MKKSISLRVNGIERSAEIEPRTTLLELVREQFYLTGAKLGCDIQVCGACTLLVDGKPVSACSVLAVDADGCEILTVEGLSEALLDECPEPSEQQIRDYLAGNFCRCGCYQEIVQAIKNVVGS